MQPVEISEPEGSAQGPREQQESERESHTATPQRESDDAVWLSPAGLPSLEYERQRKEAAQALGWRIAVLDKLVEGKRQGHDHDAMQGRALDLGDGEPGPESVNAADVLNEVAETFSRYIVLPNGAADALALWCAHTHVYDVFACSPRLNISSPDKRCGKTTLRDVISVLVPRALPTDNLTVAVLFRVVEAHNPTLLADECDAFLNDNEDLRGLLNSGHRRGGQALRCVGDTNEVRAFNVFGPAVLCGIGSLPGTLHDRSIVLRLERAKPGELRDRFDCRHTEQEQELCRKLSRFCVDNRAVLGTCDPTLLPGMFNRLADTWRPLFAIAEVAGGDWPRRAMAAYAKLTSKDDQDSQGVGVTLLSDIKKVFDEGKCKRIFSKALLASLCAMTDSAWPEANKGKAITETWIANRLRPFGVHSKDLRIGKNHAKGYEASDFAAAFDRYISDQGLSGRDTVTKPINTEPDLISERDNADDCHGLKSLETSENTQLSRSHASKAMTGASMHFMITHKMESELRRLGHTQHEIDRMTLEQAHIVLAANTQAANKLRRADHR